jgi:hypothetical protein
VSERAAILAAIGDVQTSVDPAGLYSVALDAVDGDGARVPGTTIALYAAGGSVLWRVVTDGLAPATLALDAGTYTIRASRPGYTTVLDQELVVADDTSLDIELTAATGDPAMCTIYGTLTGPDGPLVGEVISLEIQTPSEYGAWNFGGSRTTTTDATGYFAIDAPQGARIAATIDAIGWDHELRLVPAASSRAIAGWVA